MTPIRGTFSSIIPGSISFSSQGVRPKGVLIRQGLREEGGWGGGGGGGNTIIPFAIGDHLP